jgi:hypothetical protein
LFKVGFLITLLAPSRTEEEQEAWRIEAGASVTPAQAPGAEFTERMVRLAVSHDADYDGWGMSV